MKTHGVAIALLLVPIGGCSGAAADRSAGPADNIATPVAIAAAPEVAAPVAAAVLPAPATPVPAQTETAGEVACTPDESTRIVAGIRHAAEFANRAYATGDMSGINELFAEQKALNDALSPACRGFLDQLNRQVQRDRASGNSNSSQFSSVAGHYVYHDSATGSYVAPGIVSCTPSGCLPSN
jgi:hypothetical protein